jgi:hypothetical protein
MWFASQTDHAVLISEPTHGPPVITVFHANHYISDKFQTVANSAGEGKSVQRLEEALAMVGGVSDRELMERARLLIQSRGFAPRSPDRATVTAFVMLADVGLGCVQTAPGGGGSGRWIRVTLTWPRRRVASAAEPPVSDLISQAG